MISDLLSREIIRRIFTDLNIFLSVQTDSSKFRTDKTISGKFDDNDTFCYYICAGRLKLGDSTYLNCTYADLSDKRTRCPEFAAVFQLETGPIFGIKLVLDNEDNGIFSVWDQFQWKPLGMHMKAKLLASMELIVSYGYIWEKYESPDLTESLIALSNL